MRVSNVCLSIAVVRAERNECGQGVTLLPGGVEGLTASKYGRMEHARDSKMQLGTGMQSRLTSFMQARRMCHIPQAYVMPAECL